MTREQVIERLLLGRTVEAEATPDANGRRVFVEVHPVVAEESAYMQSSDMHVEPLLTRRVPNAAAIKGYRVRRCALNQGWEHEPDDWDYYLHEQKWLECGSVEELERELHRNFGLALSSFQVPGNTESPL